MLSRRRCGGNLSHRGEAVDTRALQLFVLLSAVILLPQVSDCLSGLSAALRQSIRESYTGFDRLIGERLGEDVLPDEARRILRIARRRELQEFSISPGLIEDEFLKQRITESAWPIQIVPGASSRFFLKKEKLPETCTRKSRSGGIVYAACR